MCDTVYTIDHIKLVLHSVFVQHNIKTVLFDSYVEGNAHSDQEFIRIIKYLVKQLFVRFFNG